MFFNINKKLDAPLTKNKTIENTSSQLMNHI